MCDISTNRTLCQLKENTTKSYHGCFNWKKSWFPIWGWESMICRPLVVVDPGERPMTKDNHLLGKLPEKQWISSEENPEMGSW